jgi:tetratricopeptide (TPR) repeat protein
MSDESSSPVQPSSVFRPALRCGIRVLLLSLLTALSSASQTAGQGQNPEQLTKTAEAYEKFLQGHASERSESRVAVQERLGAVYFLLHRYRDSLRVLVPILSEQPDSTPQKKDSETAISPARSMRAQSWLVAGLDHLELNELLEATGSLRRALSIQPDSANARMALGDALARSGEMEGAAHEYERQTKMTPSLADAWYKLGLTHSEISVKISHEKVRPSDEGITQQLSAEELLAKGGNLNAARMLFRLARSAAKESPSNNHALANESSSRVVRTQPDVQAELGAALLALGYVAAAQDHFQQELVKNPESPLAELGLTQTAAINGDWIQVSEKLEHLAETQPHELIRRLEFPPAGMITQASAEGRLTPPDSFTGSAEGSIWKSWLSDSNVVAKIAGDRKSDSAQDCLSGKSRDMEPGIWLTEACYSKLARELKAKSKLTSTEHVKLAEAQFRLGDYDAAFATASQLRSADPQSGWAIYWLSKSHDAMAEQCFLKVGELNPDSARVHQMLAERYLKLSDYPKAKAEFQNAIRLMPDSPDLHLGLGTVLSRSSDWPEAEKELKTTLELAPKSAFAHYELGHVYVQQGQWQPAIDQLRQVPEDSTVLLSARLDLAKAQSELGQTADGVKDLLSVAALDHDGELYFRLAGLYRSLGDNARAREAMTTFKRRRAASLQTDTEEVGALEKEQSQRIDHQQAVERTAKPQSP